MHETRAREVLFAGALVFCASCKRNETAQQIAPAETTAVVATTTTSASVEPIASAEPTASAAPSGSAKPQPDPRVLEQALREVGQLGAEPYGTIGLEAMDAGALLRREEMLPPTVRGTRLPGAHAIPPPSIRQGAITVNGRLPPEVIQRIVRQNFGRFRLCYENGLRANPALQGRVATKYVILQDGSVKTTIRDSSTDMPDPNVVQCVVAAFGNLSYPQPEGGIVTVVFPLIFNPSSP